MIIPQPPTRGSKVDTDKWLEETQQAINGQLELGDNIGGQYVDVTFVAGVSIDVHHQLKTIPEGFLVAYKIGAGDIYRPVGGTWSSTIITLQCTTSISAHIFILGCSKAR